MKLINSKKYKKRCNYDMVVIRTSKSGSHLGMSRLCEKCVIAVNMIPKKYGFKIKNIIYSNKNGDLEKTSPIKLLKSKDNHISKFYKYTNYKPHLCCNEEEDDEEEEESE